MFLFISLILNLLGDSAFYASAALTQVILTDGLTMISGYLFNMGGYPTLLSSISIPSSVTSIGMRNTYSYSILLN